MLERRCLLRLPLHHCCARCGYRLTGIYLSLLLPTCLSFCLSVSLPLSRSELLRVCSPCLHLSVFLPPLLSLRSTAGLASRGAPLFPPLPRANTHKLQGGEKAASAAVSACLSSLVRLEQENSAYVCAGGSSSGTGSAGSTECGGRGGGDSQSRCVAPEVKLYHLANACLYGASVLSGDGAEENFDWLFSR